MGAVESTLAALDDRGVIGRIQRGDHTVWAVGPESISDRLGWLAPAGGVRGQVSDYEAFAAEVRDAGFRRVALLGMGGSSLGAEVFRRAFGAGDGFPELILLDSTLPGAVSSAAAAVEPSRTLFLVASKSGTTLETRLLYDFFEGLAAARGPGPSTGASFAAITDEGTPLDELAREQNFRRVFTSPHDVGGRFSALTCFGLAPAAFTGVDLREMLARAEGMRRACLRDGPARENQGAYLGAVMAAMAEQGRDKMTLVTSPSVRGFGPWVEQLIAESTGKDGKGIIPIIDEPILPPERYGGDRLFVHLRVDGGDNDGLDGALRDLEEAGHPVLRLALRDKHDLGAEIFRWQFAAAVACALLGVHPFTQPNVESTKKDTAAVVNDFVRRGRLPEMEPEGSFEDLLSQSKAGDYLSILAFVSRTRETERALAALRRRAMEERNIATTAGYGPQYLHSTGQLHKGGPESGLFLQITSEAERDVEIPGRPFTFGAVAAAQAIGDLRSLKSLGRRTARVDLDRVLSAL